MNWIREMVRKYGEPNQTKDYDGFVTGVDFALRYCHFRHEFLDTIWKSNRHIGHKKNWIVKDYYPFVKEIMDNKESYFVKD